MRNLFGFLCLMLFANLNAFCQGLQFDDIIYSLENLASPDKIEKRLSDLGLEVSFRTPEFTVFKNVKDPNEVIYVSPESFKYEFPSENDPAFQRWGSNFNTIPEIKSLGGYSQSKGEFNKEWMTFMLYYASPEYIYKVASYTDYDHTIPIKFLCLYIDKRTGNSQLEAELFKPWSKRKNQ